MNFLCKQISDHRWGIYTDTRLLATVSDRATCEAIMASFEGNHRKGDHRKSDYKKGNRREIAARRSGLKTSVKQVISDLSKSNIAASHLFAQGAEPVEAAVAQENATQFAVASEDPAASKPGTQLANLMSDEDLARVLNLQSLKVKDLESAVLKAQELQNRQHS